MRTKGSRILGAFLAMFIIPGCATFEPGLRHQDLMRPRQPTVKGERGGVAVSIEEFATANKSLQAFDADIAPGGVLALVVKVENKGTMVYRILVEDVKAFLGNQLLSPLTGTEAANQAATSEYVGKALLWTAAAGPFAILLWPSTVAGSATHTRAVNRKIEQHFQSLEFTDSLLRPQQAAVGFKYFKLPNNVKSLENLRIEVGLSEEAGGNRHVFRLPIPTLELSSPVSVSETEGQTSE